MRKIISSIGIVALMFAAFTGVAAAQDPTMEVSPESVDAAGSADIEVTLSGYTAGAALFVVPCDFPADGDLANFDADSCDLTQLTPVVMDDDGAGVVTVTFDIAEGGLGIAAGDAAQAEVSIGAVSVGAASDDAEAEDDAETEDDAEAADLPETGSETAILVAIAFGLLAAGAYFVMGSRRLRQA